MAVIRCCAPPDGRPPTVVSRRLPQPSEALFALDDSPSTLVARRRDSRHASILHI